MSAQQLAEEWGFHPGITLVVLGNTALTTVLVLPLAWQRAASRQGCRQGGRDGNMKEEGHEKEIQLLH